MYNGVLLATLHLGGLVDCDHAVGVAGIESTTEWLV